MPISLSRGTQVLQYLDAVLGPTEAVDTGLLEVGPKEKLCFRCVNGNTTLTRTFVVNFYGPSDELICTWSPTALAASTTGIYVVGWAAATNNVTAACSIPLGVKMQITAAAPASGVGDGSFSAWLR